MPSPIWNTANNAGEIRFVRQERESTIGNRAVEGVPDLIIEILSPNTRDEHARSGKLWQAYEDHGVPLYWIVDNARRTITQHALIGEPYPAGRITPPTRFVPGAPVVGSARVPERARAAAGPRLGGGLCFG